MYEYFGVGPQVLAKVICIPCFFIGCPSIVCQCLPSVLCKFDVWWLITWLLIMWVFLFLFFLCVGFCVWLWFGFLSFWVLCNFQMSLDPWLGCEEHVECEWAQELNGRQVLFKCGNGRYWYWWLSAGSSSTCVSVRVCVLKSNLLACHK